MTETDRVALGIDGLDAILGGGVSRGQVYLVQGASGAGKTTLTLQFLLTGVHAGERVLYVGTSETEEEIQKIAASHGWSLDGVDLHHHLMQLDQDQSVLHPTDVELPRTIEAILSVVEHVGPTRLVIDSLAEIRMLARDELGYRRQLMMLRQYFTERQCTVLLVEIPERDQPALNSIVSGVVELEGSTPRYGPERRALRVRKIRGQDFATGFHDYRIRTGGIQVFPRLVAAEHRGRNDGDRVSTGVPSLDAALHGGVGRSASTLLLGPSGTGKSVLATQMAVATATRGERCDMYVFDERVQTLLERASGIELSLRPLLEDGSLRIRQIDPAEVTCGEFSHLVRRSVEDDDVRMIVLDSLNGYHYAMPDEAALTIHLHELSSFLSQRSVTTVFTMTQHGLVGERISEPFEVSYIADIVILFRHFEFAGQIRKAVSVYKNRSGPHESTIRELRIGSGGVTLGEPLGEFDGILSGRPVFRGSQLDGR